MVNEEIYRAFLRDMVYNGDMGNWFAKTNGNETGGVNMDDIQSKLDQVRYELSTERQRGAVADAGKIADLEAQEKDLVDKIAEAQTQQEKEQRDQKQQEVIDQAVDMLPTIFGALFPEAAYSTILGPNQYADLQQSFYQIIRAYTSDQIQTVAASHESEIAAKDEKIKALNKQALEVQQQLDAANHLVSTYEDQLKAEKDAHDQTQADLAAMKSQLASVQADNTAKDEKIAELQGKLDAQPKAAPSGNVQDVLAQLKSKSTFNTDDLIARFNQRQKDDTVKLPLPEVPQAGATFPDAQPENNQLHKLPTEQYFTGFQGQVEQPKVEPPAVEAPQFHEGEVPPAPVEVAAGESTHEDHQQTIEQRLEALEARVTALEGKAS